MRVTTHSEAKAAKKRHPGLNSDRSAFACPRVASCGRRQECTTPSPLPAGLESRTCLGLSSTTPLYRDTDEGRSSKDDQKQVDSLSSSELPRALKAGEAYELQWALSVHPRLG